MVPFCPFITITVSPLYQFVICPISEGIEVILLYDKPKLVRLVNCPILLGNVVRSEKSNDNLINILF